MSKKIAIYSLGATAVIGVAAVGAVKYFDYANSHYDPDKNWTRYYGTVIDESPVGNVADDYVFTINISDNPDRGNYKTFMSWNHKEAKVLEARVGIGDFVTVTGNSEPNKEFGNEPFNYVKNGQVQVVSKLK